MHAAYLVDRVAMHERRPQRHATQWTGETRDRLRLWTLNDRRVALGLRPLDVQDITAA